MNKPKPTPEDVREFILSLYKEKLKSTGTTEVSDNFDLVTGGIVDSMGIIELVSALEQEFGLELDLSDLDAEHLAVVGPLARFVSMQAMRAGSNPSA
jgi:acyl carrier protein